MSYSILVWDGPAPDSVAAAEAAVSTLSDDKAATSRPLFDTLCAALWKRWPRDFDGESEDVVWEDSFPRKPQPRRPLLAFTITLDYAQKVVPVVAREANARGLLAFDPQIGTVYLPSGVRLGADPGPPVPEDPFNAKSAMREFMAVMKKALVPLGFKWKRCTWDSRFVRDQEHGWESVAPSLDFSYGRLFVVFSFEAFLDDEDRRMGVPLRTDGFKNAVALATFKNFLARVLPDRVVCIPDRLGDHVAHSLDDTRQLAGECADIVVDEVLPRLACYRSMAEFGRVVAQRASSHVSGAFTERAISRLAAVAVGAPQRFDAVAANELAVMEARVADTRQRFPHMLPHAIEMRDEVAAFIAEHRSLE